MISYPAVQGFLSGSTISPQKYPKVMTPTTHKMKKKTSVTYGGSSHYRRDMCTVHIGNYKNDQRQETVVHKYLVINFVNLIKKTEIGATITQSIFSFSTHLSSSSNLKHDFRSRIQDPVQESGQQGCPGPLELLLLSEFDACDHHVYAWCCVNNSRASR